MVDVSMFIIGCIVKSINVEFLLYVSFGNIKLVIDMHHTKALGMRYSCGQNIT